MSFRPSHRSHRRDFSRCAVPKIFGFRLSATEAARHGVEWLNRSGTREFLTVEAVFLSVGDRHVRTVMGGALVPTPD